MLSIYSCILFNILADYLIFWNVGSKFELYSWAVLNVLLKFQFKFWNFSEFFRSEWKFEYFWASISICHHSQINFMWSALDPGLFHSWNRRTLGLYTTYCKILSSNDCMLGGFQVRSYNFILIFHSKDYSR